MRCAFCKKTSDEVQLFKGISEDGLVSICKDCAEEEKVPIIRKPTNEQIKKIDKRDSVRERMERLSFGSRDASEISDDQAKVQGNLAKLRMPEDKQMNEDVLDNYYWTLNMARRRKKMSISQLSRMSGISQEIIEDIERGILPVGFKEAMLKLESFLGIGLLRESGPKISYTRARGEEEKEIINEVKRKMGEEVGEEVGETEGEMNEDEEIRKVKLRVRPRISIVSKKKSGKRDEKLERIRKGEFDFSKRQDLENVTLNDLIEMKRGREKREREKKKLAEEDAMVGEDIDLELEEV